jgi:hypothetical protein
MLGPVSGKVLCWNQSFEYGCVIRTSYLKNCNTACLHNDVLITFNWTYFPLCQVDFNTVCCRVWHMFNSCSFVCFLQWLHSDRGSSTTQVRFYQGITLQPRLASEPLSSVLVVMGIPLLDSNGYLVSRVAKLIISYQNHIRLILISLFR